MHGFHRTLTMICFFCLSMPAVAGNFFPAEYKSFPFQEGDLVSGQNHDGKFDVVKILKVDRIEIRKGATISIQGKLFVATEDDYLLVVNYAYGKAEFNSLDEAASAANTGRWRVAIGNIPSRAPAAAAGRTLVGHKPVQDKELLGYRAWREYFDAGKAGIF
jgi:hypothetical protein